MIEDFQDISKYYAADIVGNVLTVGKIVCKDGAYGFVPDNALDRYDLVEQSANSPRRVNLIGELHPRDALQEQLEVEINSCLYLNENPGTGEIEVRSIHHGIGSLIHIKRACPLILWNARYEDDRYFDVIDIQQLFTEGRLKDQFIAMLAQSLYGSELFPPLLNLEVSDGSDTEELLHNPRLRG